MDDLGTTVLKGVSRSFYLSLRLLPGAMREAAGLGYLLARTSDTLADAAGIPAGERMGLLGDFCDAVAGGGGGLEWPESVAAGLSDPHESVLLERVDDMLVWLSRLPQGEAGLVREVVATIIGGQQFDLERFGDSGDSGAVALSGADELEQYAWQVAGCVGEFWTKLGFLTMGGGFSREDPDRLIRLGAFYGQGLQLVNILRDVPEDLDRGRCYLPVKVVGDREELLGAHARWRERAVEWVGAGRVYSSVLVSRRLRAASVLPALIAEETLERLRNATWIRLESRVKVSRSQVWLAFARSFCLPTSLVAGKE